MARQHSIAARALRGSFRVARVSAKVALGGVTFALWVPFFIVLYFQFIARSVNDPEAEGASEEPPPRRGKPRR